MSNSVKTYKINCALANTAYNVLTGTVLAPTTTAAGNSANKGKGITFQVQTGGSLVTVGGSDVVTLGGIQIYGQVGSLSPTTYMSDRYTPPGANTPSGFQAADWWVASDTGDTNVVVQLCKHV